MAAASCRLPALFLLFCLYYFSMSSTHVRFAGSLSFDIDFTHPSANLSELIVFAGDASIIGTPPMLELTQAQPDSGGQNGTGRASYAQKVPLWVNTTGEMASFTTKFSFKITPKTNTTAGDGMAFFLAASPEIPPESAGENLGLLPRAVGSKDGRFIAVEFDTFLNDDIGDQSGNHIGIDVNSVRSINYTNTTSPSRNLTSGLPMVATVTYDNRSKVLAVELQIDDTVYHVNAAVDLSTNLTEEVAVGFSAATGVAAEQHQVMSWLFSSTLVPEKPAMAPALEHPLGPTPITSSTSKHPNKVRVLLSVLVPLLFLFVCAPLGFLLWRRLVRRSVPNEDSESDPEEEHARAELERGVTAGGPRRYTYRELAAATSNFAEEEKLGQGGFGSVYRGQLTVDDQNRPVAIKMFSTNSSAQGRKEFEAEVKIISRLKHRNLVHLLGWCDSRKGLLLVYELVAESSLDKHLYNSVRLLTWPERYQIILGLGSALRYLHGEWEQCVLHGDIKPSNIMLDSSYMTKLGDFGLARLVDHGTLWQTTHKVLGTAGYIDPEFVNTGRPSTESDVYSFGIVLLEIVSGRRPVVETSDGSFTLLRWVWNLYGRNAILDATDEKLSGNKQEMERVLVIGLWCAHPDPRERPSVAHAMHILQTKDARLPTLPLHMYTAVSDPTVAAYGAFSIDSSSGVTSSTTTGSTVLSFDSPSSALLAKDRA